MNYLVKLDRARKKLLDYLFDNNRNQIGAFLNNSTVRVSNKWTFLLNNILNNPANIRYNVLVNYIDNQISKSNEFTQLIHPGLVILCYPEFESKLLFEIQNINNKTIVKINNQSDVFISNETNLMFQLYVDILTDTSIETFNDYNSSNDLARELVNGILFGLEVNSIKTEIAKLKFSISDHVYSNFVCKKIQEKNIGKKTFLLRLFDQFSDSILINTNTRLNNLNKKNIFTLTFCSGISFDETIKIDRLIKIFYIEISRYIYSNYDNSLGCMFYIMTQLNLNSPILKFVEKVHNLTLVQNTGIELGIVINEMKTRGLIYSDDFESKIKSDLCYNLEDIHDFFVFYNPISFLNSKLNISGVLALLNIPSNCDMSNTSFMTFLMEFNVYHSNFLDASLYLSKDNGERELLKDFVSNIPMELLKQSD